MNQQITPAGEDDLARIAALFELYAYDWSEMLGLDVGDDGRFRVPSLAAYRSDPRCHAFLVRCDGAIAGFALVQERSRLTGDESVRDVAELFVMRRYRRRGVGERVAAELFQRFPGKWEVRQRTENAAATAFWRRVIARCVGRFEEVVIDDDRWRGPVQRFETPRPR